MMKRYVLYGKIPRLEPDLIKWATARENSDRIVAKTKIGDSEVSTVFLGTDHAFGGGAPLLFETMIFGGKHDEFCERYSTWEEAEEGHKRAIALVEQETINETH